MARWPGKWGDVPLENGEVIGQRFHPEHVQPVLRVAPAFLSNVGAHVNHAAGIAQKPLERSPVGESATAQKAFQRINHGVTSSASRTTVESSSTRRGG
jgi:hypothetical protein